MYDTVRRNFQTLDLTEVFNFFEKYGKAEFIYKWECDGSSGQTKYHQASTQSTNLTLNDPYSNSNGDNDTNN